MYQQNYGHGYKPFKERGGCLTIWLVLLTLGAVMGFFGNLTTSTEEMDFLQMFIPALPPWYLPVSVVMALLNLVFLVGFWTWKRWGVYGYFALVLVNVILSLVLGFGVLIAVLSIGLGPLITYILIMNIWDNFE